MTIAKILVAHDFSDTATRALRYAARLARDIGATLEIGLVYPDIYDGRYDASLVLPDSPPGQGERYLRFLEEELKRIAITTLAAEGANIRCHVRRGDPVKQLEELAREIGADVICVGATGKGAVQRVVLGSVSQLVLRSSQVPVLVVP
jgi:nucleotide-binding universal stress UspA family protein